MEKQIKDGVSKIKDKKLRNILNNHKNTGKKTETNNKADADKHSSKNDGSKKTYYRSQFGKKSSKK